MYRAIKYEAHGPFRQLYSILVIAIGSAWSIRITLDTHALNKVLEKGFGMDHEVRYDEGYRVGYICACFETQ